MLSVNFSSVEFVDFVLSEERVGGQKEGVSLRDRLIKRTDHVSDEVLIAVRETTLSVLTACI